LDSSKTTLVQQCPAGLIRINIEKIPKGDCGHQHWIALDLPQAIIKELTPPDVDELKALMNNNDLIRYPPMIVDFEGTSWVVAQCCNADAVLAIRPDLSRMAQFNAKTGSTGITIFGEYLGEDAPAKIEVCPICI
jgi:predicted PhzF superfamily epimerase YddE/YHI9